MIRVNNKKAINNLSIRSLAAAKKRNILAICAIALTSVLFTSLFTISGSIIKSMEKATMRQVGTSSHGGFKFLTQEQYDVIAKDPEIKDISYNILMPFITYQTVHWGETILIIGYDLKNKVFFAIDQLEKERLNYQVYFGGVDKNIYAFEKSTLLAATIFSRPQRKFTLYTRFKNILFRYLLIIPLLYGIKTKAQYYQKPEILDRTLSEKPLIPCNKTQFRPSICHFRS